LGPAHTINAKEPFCLLTGGKQEPKLPRWLAGRTHEKAFTVAIVDRKGDRGVLVITEKYAILHGLEKSDTRRCVEGFAVSGKTLAIYLNN
jgi:nicotinic acid mononucleotide adenylyltransferase